MKAIRLTQAGGPLEEQEVELPNLGLKDVLVRIKAAGICHSDAHYRAGKSPVRRLPITLGHEVTGVVEATGAEIRRFVPGDRVCLHYLATCGQCIYCQRGIEQFCNSGEMIGKHRDGGYAEFIVVPERSVFVLPTEISFEQGAIMMCSSATALHALNQARLQGGDTVAIFGIGGLGFSAIQLAQTLGASEVFAVDIQARKLELAERLGAAPVNAAEGDPVREIKRLTSGRGADVALELIGLPLTMQQAIRVLAIKGRAVLAGITDKALEIQPYEEILNKEAEIIGVSDHLAQELPLLIEWARQGKLNLSGAVTRTMPLDAKLINQALDSLEAFGEEVRMVINPL